MSLIVLTAAACYNGSYVLLAHAGKVLATDRSSHPVMVKQVAGVVVWASALRLARLQVRRDCAHWRRDPSRWFVGLHDWALGPVHCHEQSRVARLRLQLRQRGVQLLLGHCAACLSLLGWLRRLGLKDEDPDLGAESGIRGNGALDLGVPARCARASYDLDHCQYSKCLDIGRDAQLTLDAREGADCAVS